MADVSNGQEEHEQIATSLEVEQLDVNIFRSKSLWLPVRARGVYGGQVISQALVSATKCVDPAYSLHVSAWHSTGRVVLLTVLVSVVPACKSHIRVQSRFEVSRLIQTEIQCYFLLGASPAAPIVYHVGRARDGRSYVTRSVKATQRGRTVFVMICSFQRPEPGQPVHQWPMPPGVPDPDKCEDVEGYYERLLRYEGLDPKMKEYAEEYIAVCVLYS